MMKLKANFLVLSALFILLGNSLALAVSDLPSGEVPSGEVTSGETTSGEGPTVVTPSGETPATTPSGEVPSGEIVPNLSGEESGEIEDDNILLSTANDSNFTIKKNTTLTAAMEATTSGDETFIFSIATNPAHGTVTQTSSGDASFTYTPAKDYVGNDLFTFRLESGEKYSNIGKIAITIKGDDVPVIPFHYVDMQEHWANYSASHLAARGLIIGEEINDKYYFNPERKMTRSDFLLFLLAIADPDHTTSGEANVKFADADSMPSWLLKNANEAYQMGIIKGVGSGNSVYFYPDKEITRAEAFVMINNALLAKTNIKDSKMSGDLGYKDSTAVPEWAKQAIKNLSDYKIIQGDTNKNVTPNSLVSRAQAAELCYKLLKEFENQALSNSGDPSAVTPSGDLK